MHSTGAHRETMPLRMTGQVALPTVTDQHRPSLILLLSYISQRDHAPLPHRLMTVEGKVITPPQSLGSTNLPHEPSVHDIIDCKLITLSPTSTTNNIPLY